jgi:hypothetical protein
MAGKAAPTKFIDVVIRTVDRVKDRAAVIGLAFLLVGILGCLLASGWSLLAAFAFYLVWGGLRMASLWRDAERAAAKGNDRLAAAIEDANRRLREQRLEWDQHRPVRLPAPETD